MPSHQYTNLTSNAYPQQHASKAPSRPGEPIPWQATDSHSAAYISSGTARGSGSSGSAHYPLPRLTDPGLENGVDYFRIGEIVRVRKFIPSKQSYTDWVYGQVNRPHLRPLSNDGNERVYFVSYLDPRNAKTKESDFSPSLREIGPLLSVEQLPGGQKRISKLVVFALVNVKPNVNAWTAAQVMAQTPDKGVHVRLLAGPLANRDMKGVRCLAPYNAFVASTFQQLGMRVDGVGQAL